MPVLSAEQAAGADHHGLGEHLAQWAFSEAVLLGGRVEFLEEENPVTALMDGIATFHVYITPPSPNREIEFILEYDVNYLNALFE